MKEETNKMINEQYKKMLEGKSVIRQLSELQQPGEKRLVMRMSLTTVSAIRPCLSRMHLMKR